MRQQQTNTFENLITRRVRTGRLRRFVAMLSAFVLLTTMNTLKLNADTLERIATCGIAQHVHDESCYDADGKLACGLEEHVHTDACYQQRPTAEDKASTRIDEYVPLDAQVRLASPVEFISEDDEDTSVESSDVDDAVDEVMAELQNGDADDRGDEDDIDLLFTPDDEEALPVSGEDATEIDDTIFEVEGEEEIAAEDESEAEAEMIDGTIEDEVIEGEVTGGESIEGEVIEGETIEVETTDEENTKYTYELGDRREVLLSTVLEALGIQLDQIDSASAAKSDEAVLSVALNEDGDYVITALEGFEKGEIVVVGMESETVAAYIIAITAAKAEEETEVGEADKAEEAPEIKTEEEVTEEKKDAEETVEEETEKAEENAEKQTEVEEIKDEDGAEEVQESDEESEAAEVAIVENDNVTIVPVGDNSLSGNLEIVYNENVNKQSVVDRLDAILSGAYQPGMMSTSSAAMSGLALAGASAGNETAGQYSDYAVFDISLLDDGVQRSETGEVGVVVRPENVNIYDNLPGNATATNVEYTLYHIHNSAADTLPVSVDCGEDGSLLAVDFTTDSFSYFVLKYTVDFHYNGVDYSIPGESQILLSTLIDILNITDESGAKIDVADVVDVSFTDEHLVKVEQVSGLITYNDAENVDVGEKDFLLTSLEPFTSDEVLTITLTSGETVKVGVSDATYSNNLGDFLDSIAFTGVETDESGNYVVKQGVPYTMQMNFSEKTNGVQFTENQSLIYTFPNGFTPVATSGDVTMTGAGGPVSFHYEVSGNTMTVTFDPASAGYESFVKSEGAEFEVHIAGVISEEEINFNTTTTGNFSIDKTAGISVSKKGTYDPATNKIKYTVYATAVGNNTNVHIGDTISGSALTYDSTSGLTVTSNKSDNVSYTTNPQSGETLGIDIASMQHGETITLEYYADVDLTKVSDNGQGSLGTIEQTGNTVKAKSTQQPDPSESTSQGSSLENKISISSVGKSAGEPIVNEETGKTTITWTITLNDNANISLGGKTITDTIDSGSQSIMRYTGHGIHVEKYNKDGSQADAYSVNWGQNGLTDGNGKSTWSYTIPSTDTDKYKYVITYTTEVDSDTFLKTTQVKNLVSDDYGSAGGGSNVESTGETVTATKSAVSSTVDTNAKTAETEWEITFTVPAAGLNSAVVTDNLPKQNEYQDTYKTDSFSIDSGDLLTGEDYVLDTSDPSKLVVTFKKNNDPGLLSSDAERTIHMHFTTIANHDWLVFAETNSWARSHANSGDVTVNGQKIDIGATVSYNTTEQNIEKAHIGTDSTSDTSLPIYQYRIVLTGINDETFDKDGYLVVEDTYNSVYLTYKESYATYNGGNINTPNGHVYGNDLNNKTGMTKMGPYVVDASSTEGRLVFKLNRNTLPMENSTYYPYYAIYYSLQVKDAAAFENLKNSALHSEGLSVPMDNTATSEDFGSATVTTNYVANGLTKEKVFEGANETTGTYDIKFRINVNPDALKIGDGDTITVTDTLTNLSFDYTSIVVDPKLEGDILNRQNNNVVFTLHNQQPYTITYTTRLVGLNNVAWSNDANLNGLIKSSSGTSSASSGGSGSYTSYTMNVQKYAEGNMNEGLAATFKLYEARIKDSTGADITPNWQEIATFTTDSETGIFNINEVIRDTHTGNLRPYSYHDENEVEKFDGGDKYGWYYKLVETVAPTGYQKEDTEYFFGISDKPNYTEPYTYLNDDTVTIINKPAPKTGVSVNKSWVNQDGSTTWPDGLEVAFTLKKQSSDGTVSALTSADLGDKWETLNGQLTKTLTQNPGKVEETWADLPELANGAVYVVEETPVAGYNVYAMDEDGNYNRGTIAANVNHVASFRNENNIVPVDEDTELRLTVEKKWQDEGGNPVTQGLPDSVTFELERTRTFGVPKQGGNNEITLILQADGSQLSAYSFERGTEAMVSYEYINENYAQNGNPSYTVNGGSSISLKGGTTGTFTVRIPSSGQAIVNLKNNDWGQNMLGSASAVGTPSMDYTTEPDTDYNADPDTITVSASNAWTNNIKLPKIEEKEDVTYTYTYKIKEQTIPGWEVTYSENNATGISDTGKVTATNTNTSTDISVTVNKTWYDEDGEVLTANPENTTATFTLFVKDGSDNLTKAEVPGEAIWTNPTIISDDTLSVTFDKLPILPDGSKYIVKEAAVDGYTTYAQGLDGTFAETDTSEVVNNRAAFINVPTKDIEVTKQWKKGGQAIDASETLTWTDENTGKTIEYTLNNVRVVVYLERYLNNVKDDTFTGDQAQYMTIHPTTSSAADGMIAFEGENPTVETTVPMVPGSYEQTEEWQFKWSDLPAVKVNDNGTVEAYEYKWVEKGVYLLHNEEYIDISGDYTSAKTGEGFVNTAIETVSVEASKVFEGNQSADEQPSAVQFTLYRRDTQAGSGETEDVEVTKDAHGNDVAPQVIVKNEGWTGKVNWSDLPKYAADGETAATYVVKETGVYFGEVAEGGESAITGWVNPTMYTVEGGEVNDGEATITNTPVTVNVPVTKEWEDFDTDDSYDWSVTFRLQWAPKYSEEGTATDDDFKDYYLRVNGAQQTDYDMTISKDQMADPTASLSDRTFSNLPKYGVDDQGRTYRIQYSLDEISYEVKQNDSVIYSYDKATGVYYPADEEHYEPFYPHDAGELSAEDTDYYIRATNHKKNTQDEEYINVQVTKTWKDANGDPYTPEDWETTFQIMRYKGVGYRDISNVDDPDAEPISVTLGNKTIEVVPGTGVRLVFGLAGYTSGPVSLSYNVGGTSYSVSFENAHYHADPQDIITTAFYPTQDTTVTYAAGGGLNVLSVDIIDTLPGVAPAEDTAYTAQNNTFTLDKDHPSATLRLLRSDVSAGADDGQQNVNYYEYFFKELSSNPDGYYVTFTDEEGHSFGTAASRLTADSNLTATNRPIPPFYVKKEWHDIEDPDNYPEIRFTLYQGVKGTQLDYSTNPPTEREAIQNGQVFVGENGESYVDIPLNSDNNWSWKCPGYLPTTNAQGQEVGYYVVENTGTDNNSRQVKLYNNSELNEDGSIKVAGAEITTSQSTKDEVWLWDYYNDKNSNHAYRNDQQMPRGYDGGIVGNEGTLTIVNRSPKYMQMDIKKKIMEYQSDGSLATTTDWASRTKDIVLKIQLMRRIYIADAAVDAEPLVNWENYGVPFYVGYDSDGHDIAKNDNDFDVGVGLSAWHWTILNQNDENGLPAYGYYTKENGEIVKVHYRYIPFEVGAYSDLNESPINPEFDWFIGLQPNAWDGAHGQVPTFTPMVGQDQDRLMNVQASDLEVDKDWTETPDNVEEVYIKIYRQAGSGSIEDFTTDIATRTETLSNYGFVDDPTRLTTLDNGALVLGLTPETGGVLIHSVLITPATDNANLNTNYYMYWIEEVGYKDKDGNVYFTNGTNSATSTFFPQYDHSDNQGNWTDSWTYTPTDNKIKLSTKGNNKLRVKNRPTKDVEVEKKWIDSNGTELTAPWTTSPAITSVSFKVKRNDDQYLTFNGSETLTIKTNGQRAVVRTAVKDSTEYTVTYVNDTDDKADIGSWTTLVHGLQKYASNGTEYTYTVEELVDQNGKPLDGSNNVIQNCHTSVSGSESSGYVITNEKVDTSLAIKKTFAGDVLLTDEQKQKITFEVTGKFDGTNEETRTFTYGKDGLTVNNEQQQTDIYKWSDGVLVIKDIKAGVYTVKEQNDGVGVVFEGDTSGKTYIHTRTYTVGTTDSSGDSVVAIVDDGARTTVVVTNTYDESKDVAIEANKQWMKGEDDVTAQITGKTVTLTLQKSTDGKEMTAEDKAWTDVSSVILNGTPEAAEASDGVEAFPEGNSEHNFESAPWKAYWPKQPRFEGQVRINYRVVETKIDGANVASIDARIKRVIFEGESDETGTAENVVNDLRDFEVEKKWVGYTPDPEKTKVTLTLHRAIKVDDILHADEAFSDTITLPEAADQPADEVEENPWKKTWINLPKDGEVQVASDPETSDSPTVHHGNWIYYVTEDEVEVDGTTVKDSFIVSDGIEVNNGENNKSTVTNTYDLKDFSFKKKWTDGVTTNARKWPEDAEGNKVPITVVLNGKLIETVEGEGTVPKTLLAMLDEQWTASTYEFVINPAAEENDPNHLPMSKTIKIGGVDTPVTVSLVDDGANGYTIKFEGLRKTGKKTENEVTTTGEWQYYVTEEQISGYQLPKYQKADGNYHETGDGGAYEGETIVNEPIVYELPSTGGPGTTGLYVLGSILTLLAAVLLITRKRTDAQGIE